MRKKPLALEPAASPLAPVWDQAGVASLLPGQASCFPACSFGFKGNV